MDEPIGRDDIGRGVFEHRWERMREVAPLFDVDNISLKEQRDSV